MTKRREFFKELFSQLYVLKEEATGHRHFKLTDLWKMNDTKFKQMKFRVRPGVAIQYNTNNIYSRKSEDETILICDKGSEQELMFQCMQQRMSVAEIAEKLSLDDELNIEEPFKTVREFMLYLVKNDVLIPAVDIHYTQEDEKEGSE